jgi:hypothetical protein
VASYDVWSKVCRAVARGAAITDMCRAVLGLALTALTTLAGGEAVYGLWGEAMYMLADGAPLPAEARAISYAAFWFLQLVISSGTSAGTRLLVLGRAAVLAVGRG